MLLCGTKNGYFMAFLEELFKHLYFEECESNMGSFRVGLFMVFGEDLMFCICIIEMLQFLLKCRICFYLYI